MRNRTAIALIVAPILGIIGANEAALSAEGQQAAASAPLAKRQYPACPTEDSANCIRVNHGPGYSTVHGPNAHPSPSYHRVSDELARKLRARRGTWQRPGQWLGLEVDQVSVGPRDTFVVNKRTVVSVGDTTYFIRNGRVASS